MNIGRHRNVILVYEHRLRHWRFLGKKIITSELKTSLNIQLGPEYQGPEIVVFNYVLLFFFLENANV